MNLLTFLGTAKYQQTTYTLNAQRYTTCYCPAAVAHFCRPESTLVVVTKGAQDMHFEALADEISGFTRPIAVPIPDGHSEADLWRIFDALTRQVSQGDELVVDITNGFRSLPFLSFLAVAFLRIARQVKVNHIYYGAWEARNQETNESPIFNLTPFVTLLDWLIATNRFTRFGDASDLAGLLTNDIPPGYVLATDLEARKLRDGLKNAAGVMESVSLALRLARPLETMAASQALVGTLGQVGPLVGQKARPFSLLTEQVSQTYQPLALSEAEKTGNWPQNLLIQFDLIYWYLSKGQIVQAITLAREWLVSLLVYHFQAGALTDYGGARRPIEIALGNAAERQKKAPGPVLETPYDKPLQDLPSYDEIGQMWGTLTQLRNDTAHVGMRPNPGSARSLRDRACDLYSSLWQIGAFFLPLAELTGEKKEPCKP